MCWLHVQVPLGQGRSECRSHSQNFPRASTGNTRTFHSCQQVLQQPDRRRWFLRSLSKAVWLNEQMHLRIHWQDSGSSKCTFKDGFSLCCQMFSVPLISCTFDFPLTGREWSFASNHKRKWQKEFLKNLEQHLTNQQIQYVDVFNTVTWQIINYHSTRWFYAYQIIYKWLQHYFMWYFM